MTRAASARPLSLPDIVSAAFHIYVRDLRRFLLLAIPQAALTIALLSGLALLFDAMNLPSTTSGDGIASVDLATALRLMLFFGLLAFVGVTASAVADAFLLPTALARARRPVASAAAIVAPRPSLLLKALAAGLLIGAAMAVMLMAALVLSPLGILLVPLMLYLYVLWGFTVLVLVEQGGSPIAAMQRSRALVRGSWWRVAAIFAAIYALSALPPLAGEAIGTSSGSEVLNVGISALAILTAAPFAAIARTLLYLDVQLRKSSAGQAPPAAAG